MNKRGQVWVETVLYTLIAFALIGAALSFVKPKIEEMQDKAIIDQSVSLLQGIDTTMKDIERKGHGNKRKLEIKMGKGSLTIDSQEDTLIFQTESKAVYSEPGVNVYEGNILINTLEQGEYNKVILSIDYKDDYNITFNNQEDKKIISSSTGAKILFIENKGGDPTQINFETN